MSNPLMRFWNANSRCDRSFAGGQPLRTDRPQVRIPSRRGIRVDIPDWAACCGWFSAFRSEHAGRAIVRHCECGDPTPVDDLGLGRGLSGVIHHISCPVTSDRPSFKTLNTALGRAYVEDSSQSRRCIVPWHG